MGLNDRWRIPFNFQGDSMDIYLINWLIHQVSYGNGGV